MTGDDVGETDPRLSAALAAGDVAAVRETLLVARLLVPVVATGDETHASAAEMAVPGLVGADGRHALPVFTSSASLRAWRPDARPVPMPGARAVTAAADEGYAAIVLDVAGPRSHVVAGQDLVLLAAAARALSSGEAGSVRVWSDDPPRC